MPSGVSWKPFNGVKVLKNVQCVYCGCAFDDQKPTGDHVIARKFVPSGSFEANDWNLIVNACASCNNVKSALENEVSAVTLQPGIGASHNDAMLADLARRKAAKVRSKASGKLVKDSVSTTKIDGTFAENGSVSFGFVAPPQLTTDSVMRLAGSQLQAFFYLITYDEKSRKGRFMPRPTWSHFTRRSDWGSRLFTSFADVTRFWLPRIQGNAAKDHFRIALKRKDADTDLWSFALEWNKELRIVGVFGDPEESSRLVDSLIVDEMVEFLPGERYREEIPLESSEDDLFECHPPG